MYRQRDKTRGAIAAQVRHEHVVTLRCQQRSNVDIAVNVVRPAMQENHGSTIAGTCFRVADIEETCIDLLDGPEGTIRARYVLPAGLCLSKAAHCQCNGSNDSDSDGDRHRRI